MLSFVSARRVVAAVALVSSLMVSGAAAQQELVMEPLKDAGLTVYPAFEGWFQNADGTYTILIGYYNRNKKQILDVPIGPNNRIEPGGPDQGQPTHFLVGRGWGTTSIRVPKDFGDKKLVWTLTTNGKTVSVPFGLTKGYQIEPYLDAAMGNKPPVFKFSENGEALTGPPKPLSAAPVLAGVVGEPVTISAWLTDDGHEETPTGGAAAAPPAGAQAAPRRPRISATISKFRGPGDVTFADSTPDVEKDRISTTAKFSMPGEYVIRIEGNDSSGVGGGGFQCCWSTAFVKVNVKAAGTGGN